MQEMGEIDLLLGARKVARRTEAAFGLIGLLMSWCHQSSVVGGGPGIFALYDRRKWVGKGK